MRLYLRKLQTPGLVRSMFVATPDSEPDAMGKLSAITILRDDADEASARDIIATCGMQRLVDEQRAILVFPNPSSGSWNYRLSPELPRDAEFVAAINESLNGAFTDGWRVTHDVHYLLGFGSGASLVNTLVAAFPSVSLAAAVCTVGGVMCDEALDRAVHSAVPAYIIDGDTRAVDYYVKANSAISTDDAQVYVCQHNPMQGVRVSSAKSLCEDHWAHVWDEFLSRIRRTNTSLAGDVDRRIVPAECGFCWHVHDTRLGDNGGLDHDWIEHVPDSVRQSPETKVPLVIFSHGMNNNPLNAAEITKLHEIGEREGFVTVYPFSSDRIKWNLNMSRDHYDDVAYYLALIDYLKGTYPIDETRIYLSGFSNGAGMAMTFALAHPELIAAIFPIDSTFPYANMTFFDPGWPEAPFVTEVLEPGQEPRKPFLPTENAEENLAPLRAALARQATRAYRMPVMYFYGTRETEYPIRKGCNQQAQYDFWKAFNNIPLQETVDMLEPDAVGVRGDDVYELYPSKQHPEHRYTQHVFYSNDDHKDLYNFALMHGKAHEVHPAEGEMGWAYVSRFRRHADGSLSDTSE